MRIQKSGNTWHFKLFVAAFTACFTLSSLNPAQAQTPSAKTPIVSSAMSALTFRNIQIPEAMAVRDKTYLGKKPETIWILNDAHAVPAAQESISQTIQHLQKTAGLRLVGVEGVSGDFETTLFRAFPDSEKLNQELKTLWARGELSGATLAALSGHDQARYFGAESAPLYKEGLDIFFSARDAAPLYQERLNAIDRELAASAGNIFPKELAELESDIKRFKKGDARAIEIILKKVARKLPNLNKEFPHLSALAQELNASEQFSQEMLGAWSHEIIIEIKNKEALKEFSSKEQLWKTGGFSDAQFAAFAIRFCRAQGWAPKIPAELLALARRGEMLYRIRSGVFLAEWEGMLAQLEAKFVASSKQRDLLRLVHESELMSAWVKLELSRKDWKLTAKPLSQNSDNELAPLFEKLEKLRSDLAGSVFEKFYQNAQAREKALLENTIKQMHAQGTSSAALVVGGFHADGLAALLEERKTTYSVLTPTIAELPAQSNYDALMRGDVSWKQYLRIENGEIKLYESFARWLTHQLLDLEGERKDPTRALADYQAWRENLTRDLSGAAAQKNIQALALLDEIVLEAVYPAEYPALKADWQHTASKILPVLQRLKKIGKLNFEAALAVRAMTMNAQAVNPLVASAFSVPSRTRALWSSRTTEVVTGRGRSEMRETGETWVQANTPNVAKTHFYSLQMENGYPLGFLKRVKVFIDELKDRPLKQWLSMSVLTGGLGALMTDLFEAWTAIGMRVTGLHPAWNYIKNRPETGIVNGKKVKLFEIAKKAMTDTGTKFEIELNITQGFLNRAQESPALRSVLKETGPKKLYVHVYKTESTFWKTPHYYFDATYENGESVFNEVYDDDRPMREFQMAAYNQMAQRFIQIHENDDNPSNIAVIAHETFTSLPFRHLKRATEITFNHTVFRPGLETPSEAAYELMEFPEYLRSSIVVDGRISIADYVGETYHVITGVALVEHMGALYNNIFPTVWHKVKAVYDALLGIAGTNGIYFERWEDPLRRNLIEQFKKKLKISKPLFGLTRDTNDRDLYKVLELENNADALDAFKRRNEWISAAGAARLLVWLNQKQNFKGRSDWLAQTLGAYMRGKGIGLGQLPKALKDFEKALKQAMRANKNQEIAAWKKLEEGYGDLRDELLTDPMGQNLRRQVPYKGPDKYEEILQIKVKEAAGSIGLDFHEKAYDPDDQWKEEDKKKKRVFHDAFQFWKAHHEGNRDNARYERDITQIRERLKKTEAVQKLKEHMARILIGGRTFDVPQAYERFLYMQFLTELLGLEDRFGFVQGYNQYEAEIAFQGVQFGNMLSDKNLEAAASGYGKSGINGARSNAVYGGAPPEAWGIVDDQGSYIQVLDEDGDPKYTYEIFAANIASGKWRIVNGDLIRYSSGEKSNQVGGGERPSAESLLEVMRKTRRVRSDPQKRRDEMYATLSNSWRLNMVSSQALAHARLFENVLVARQKREKLLAAIHVQPGDYKHITAAPSFEWNIGGSKISDQGGLIGTLTAFRRLKTWTRNGDIHSRGQDLLVALKQHAAAGDVFKYILDHLAPLSSGASPLRQAISDLKDKASQPGLKERFKVALNLEALDLVDEYILKAAGKWFESYIREQDPARIASSQKLLEETAIHLESGEQQQPWAEYIARYLDNHPTAVSLKTSDSQVRSFVFTATPGENAALVNLSVRASSAEEDEEKGKIRKSRATAYLTPQAAKALGGEAFGTTQTLFRIVEDRTGDKYKIRFANDLAKALSVGVPLPLGVEVLALKPVNIPLANLFHRAARSTEDGIAVDELRRLIQELARPDNRRGQGELKTAELQARFRAELADLVELDANSIANLFDPQSRRAVMAFILMVAPDLFERVKPWHEDFYARLNAFRTERPDFFSDAELPSILISSRNSTLVFAKKEKHGDSVLIASMVFSAQTDLNQRGKLNTTVQQGLEKLFRPGEAVSIYNPLRGKNYANRSDLMSGWQIRIPVQGPKQIDQDRVQFLVVTPNRSEVRTQNAVKTPAASAKNLGIFAAFFLFLAGLFGNNLALATKAAAPPHAALVLEEKHPHDVVPQTIAATVKERFEFREGNFFTANISDQLDSFAAKHFAAHPTTPLHLGFTIAYDDSLDNMLLGYAEKINALQRDTEHGALIMNRLTVLLAPDQEMSPLFAARAAKLGIVTKKLEAGKEAAPQIVAFLHKERGRAVFAYGLARFGVASADLHELQYLAVEGSFSLNAVFNPAVMLNMATASSGVISAELVQQIPQQYGQFVGLGKNGALTLLDTILKTALLEARVHDLIASMA